MPGNKDRPPYQRNLFDFDDVSNLVLRHGDNEIDDATRDALLSSILSLNSIKGVGFKTICAAFDAGVFHNFW